MPQVSEQLQNKAYRKLKYLVVDKREIDIEDRRNYTLWICSEKNETLKHYFHGAQSSKPKEIHTQYNGFHQYK